jgi:probable F420-dependent oxidoreductase
MSAESPGVASLDGPPDASGSASITLGDYGMAITDVIRQHLPDDVTAVLGQLEAHGVWAVWFGESVGGESMATAGVLLARSKDLIVAPGIANIAARSPASMAAGRRILTDAYPGRFLLGLGSSHESIVRSYGAAPIGSQLESLRSYVDAMHSTPGGVGNRRVPIVIAALGPKMLDLSVEYGFGTHPWNVTVERLAWMRARVGPDTLIAPRQAIMLCDDVDLARRAGRAHLAKYLEFPNYRRNWLRQGYTEDDLSAGGSDRLVDGMIAWGPPDRVARRLRELWDAGVDHLGIHPLPRPDQTTADTVVEAAVFLRDVPARGSDRS